MRGFREQDDRRRIKELKGQMAIGFRTYKDVRAPMEYQFQALKI